MEKYNFFEDWLIIKTRYPREIVLFIEELFQIMEIRGRVGKIQDITFVIHTNEKNHSIPHIHVEYGEFSASIALDDGRVLSGNIPSKQHRVAEQWIMKNKNKLLNDWSTIAISATSITTSSRFARE